MSDGLPERILAATAARFPDGSLLVALSGGPDSAVAAWISTRVEPPREVVAVFVDHGWPDSPTMGSAAAAIAGHLGVPLTVGVASPSTTEGDARNARLAILERLAAEHAPGTSIVTGHHADDVAETVVLHLLRGAGSSGLAGIPERRPPFVRPLLRITGSDLRKAAEELELPFGVDPANDDRRHLRSRVRHEVLPALEAVEPSVKRNLTRSAVILAADDVTLEERAGAVPVRREGGAILVPWGPLASLPQSVSARVVRRALRLVRPPYAGDARDVATVLAVRRGATPELSGGLRCERDGGYVAIYDPADLLSRPPATTLSVPGRARFGPFSISAREDRVPSAPPPKRRTVWIDAALLDGLEVRPATEGERIDVGGGHKPVREAMAEAGIAPRLRASWPVVSARGRIAWLVEARVAAWAATSPSLPGIRLESEGLPAGEDSVVGRSL